jgi:hypothetical protein
VCGERAEVCRNIAVFIDSTVNPADAAGRKHCDTSAVSKQERGRHGGGTEVPPLRNGKSEFTLTHLARWSKDQLVFRLVEAHARLAVKNCGDCRHCALATDCSDAAM